MLKRRKTRRVRIGSLYIGSTEPVLIQSMTNTDTGDINATIDQIRALTEAGCEAVRIAVPDKRVVGGLTRIKAAATVPLIADIHFDLSLALDALAAGFDKLRINPGTLGNSRLLREVARAAVDQDVSIRVGVNSGSIHRGYANLPMHEALAKSAEYYCQQLESFGCHNLVVSLKSSSVEQTVLATRLFAASSDYPLHLGVTEAGTLSGSVIKSSIGIGTLLVDGIGDTIRVSVTGSPLEEIPIARGILRSLNLRPGSELVSCPTCGRCSFPLAEAAQQVEERLNKNNCQLKVAVMGCAVNGPGEAKEADLGIAFGPHKGVLFAKGEVVKTMPNSKLVKELLTRIEHVCKGDQERRD
ncbi:MAG: flavodoxin-dependent (E)-4-hydroxy-3-methylbut-2-enyl-diphosphate synthase [Firmicutes bacterium]|nr:flavodoxin-dependent (E)-4-hydroxy-3-methylbut-2-enyl-diphosphate synthase [Bacillota bacterium]